MRRVALLFKVFVAMFILFITQNAVPSVFEGVSALPFVPRRRPEFSFRPCRLMRNVALPVVTTKMLNRGSLAPSNYYKGALKPVKKN